jgi:hypothetical protein
VTRLDEVRPSRERPAPVARLDEARPSRGHQRDRGEDAQPHLPAFLLRPVGAKA